MRLQALYLKLPPTLRLIAEHLPLRYFRRKHDRALRSAWLSGPPYRPSHRRIVIDITADCSLHCVACNRSCGARQAPAPEHMTVEQIERFVAETRRQNRHWEVIQIEGGEPTLNPQFLDIIHALQSYVTRDSLATVIQVNTSGYSECNRSVARQIPKGVAVYCSGKTQAFQPEHVAFNVAPADVAEHAADDFSQGCCLPSMYGLGLTRYGYYPHPICGGIDRIFGMDIARKALPDVRDGIDEVFQQLCRYCGLFVHYNRSMQPHLPRYRAGSEAYPIGTMTESWKQAYSRYRMHAPGLRPY